MSGIAVMAAYMALAAVLGLAAHKAGICMVKAVAEVFTSRRPFLLWCFAKTSLWSLAVFAVFGWMGNGVTYLLWPAAWTSLAGGAVFGLGAGLNGACVFSSLSRLAEGRLAMLAAAVMWPAGALLQRLAMGVPSGGPAASPELSPLLTGPAAAVLLAWALWEARKLLVLRSLGAAYAFLKAHVMRLSGAAALIGIGNGLLYQRFQNWSFTSAANRLIAGETSTPMADGSAVLLLLASAMCGMFASAVLRGAFRIETPRMRSLARHAAAGMAMGFGAAMIPGGNDALILHGLPALSPHAFPAILGVAAGIAAFFGLMRMLGMSPPHVACRGDFCLAK